MRGLFCLLACCLGLLTCKAQSYPLEGDLPIVLDSSTYLKDSNNNFNKFEGTWEYDDGTIKLTVFLEKIEDYSKAAYFSDRVLGNFIFEENGVEIVNTLTNPSTSQGSDDVYHIDMFGINEPTKIIGWFEDPIRSKWTRYSLYLTYSENYPTLNGPPQPQLQWSISIRSFYNPDNDPNAEQASRVPRLLTLNKI